jgi:hypothetical protein
VLRHYKGGRYRVTGYCLIEATLETGVLYEPLPASGAAPGPGVTWMRPLPQFSQPIETPAGVVPRFCVESGDA